MCTPSPYLQLIKSRFVKHWQTEIALKQYHKSKYQINPIGPSANMYVKQKFNMHINNEGKNKQSLKNI